MSIIKLPPETASGFKSRRLHFGDAVVETVDTGDNSTAINPFDVSIFTRMWRKW